MPIHGVSQKPSAYLTTLGGGTMAPVQAYEFVCASCGYLERDLTSRSKVLKAAMAHLAGCEYGWSAVPHRTLTPAQRAIYLRLVQLVNLEPRKLVNSPAGVPE